METVVKIAMAMALALSEDDPARRPEVVRCECSTACTCGCQEGLPCVCGEAKPVSYPAEAVLAGPPACTVSQSVRVPFVPQPRPAAAPVFLVPAPARMPVAAPLSLPRVPMPQPLLRPGWTTRAIPVPQMRLAAPRVALRNC